MEDYIRLGIHHVNKLDFITAYPTARAEALTASNIHSGFAATGLVPFDPSQVLSKLQIHTTPPGSPHGSTSSIWTPKTPRNTVQLQKQVLAFKSSINRGSRSPPSSAERLFSQIVKGSEMIMQNAAFLLEENKQLRAANDRQKAKRARKYLFISHSTTLTAVEGVQLVQQSSIQDTAPAAESNGVRQRAPPRCSLCNSLQHNARTCPKRQ